EAPSIHSDDQPGPVSESLPAGALIVLLLTGLFLSGWFAWRQYQPPVGIYQPPVTLPVDKVRTVSEPVVNENEPAQVTPEIPTVSVSAGQQRTPVESFQPAANTATSLNSGVQEPPAEESETALATSAINKQAGNDKVTIGPSDSISSTTETSLKQASAEEEPFHPGEPAPIGYWELPDAVRSDVPEIKYSVLVFATDPADRFVLINGQRLGEGDSARPGLVVKEIRRDGVVFSYRLYQFLVEK
ncbi:general secretion pathway protein GspB, partial [Eudoraea sp.]|uniref:general secretion pathway protein GspB n=1 Tax=Eudoraea sp. TaxID=1979955 RepID=UPI003C76080B